MQDFDKKLRELTYNSWRGMKGRCSQKSHKYYHNYGGRGIEVCDRWQSFENFVQDMGFRPSKEYSIDRVDNDRNYCPENCQWLTKIEQDRKRKMQSNNSSGYTGVHYDRYKNSFVAQWKPIVGGNQKSKSFSVSKYGEELAELLAIEYRYKMIWELNQLGMNYSDSHGK
jgi:hypothetical protein